MSKTIRKKSTVECAPKQADAVEPIEMPLSVLDDLIKKAGGSEAVLGPNGLLKQLTAALVNRALQVEMTSHLGYECDEVPPDDVNRRNGQREKTLRSGHGPITIEVPRDRAGTFEPKIVPKHQRHFAGFDDQILAMYARGMTTRDIQAHLHEIYGVDVSPDLVSRVTDGIMDELRAWQSRPVEEVYPIVYVDALVTKIRDKGMVENKAIYVVMGVDVDGNKDVLGLWIQRTEGAKFWLSILTELKSRGLKDIFILCADGLTGMAEAVEAVFPETIFQTCIVHMVRASTRYVSYQDLREICVDMRGLYTVATVDEAKSALQAFEAKWETKYPHAVRPWRARFEEWTAFLSLPLEVRRAVYTTNAIEALNRHLRKALKTRGPLPSDDAALKLVFLAIRNAMKKSGRMARDWSSARAQLAIIFAERWPPA